MIELELQQYQFRKYPQENARMEKLKKTRFAEMRKRCDFLRINRDWCFEND